MESVDASRPFALGNSPGARNASAGAALVRHELPAGAQVNHAIDDGGETRAVASNFVPALGNFSIQYNFTSASIAVQLLADEGYLGHPLEPEPNWSEAVTLPTVFLGAMIGMLFMGRLGDVLGRVRAMQLTLCLALLGALLPALAAGPADAVYAIVCVGRFVLGVGVSPPSPPRRALALKRGGKGTRVGKAFFWQRVGQSTPYVVAMLLLALCALAEPATWIHFA